MAIVRRGHSRGQVCPHSGPSRHRLPGGRHELTGCSWLHGQRWWAAVHAGGRPVPRCERPGDSRGRPRAAPAPPAGPSHAAWIGSAAHRAWPTPGCLLPAGVPPARTRPWAARPGTGCTWHAGARWCGVYDARAQSSSQLSLPALAGPTSSRGWCECSAPGCRQGVLRRGHRPLGTAAAGRPAGRGHLEGDVLAADGEQVVGARLNLAPVQQRLVVHPRLRPSRGDLRRSHPAPPPQPRQPWGRRNGRAGKAGLQGGKCRLQH